MLLRDIVIAAKHALYVDLQGVLKERLCLKEGLQKLLEISAQHEEVQWAFKLVDTGFKLELGYFWEIFGPKEQEELG